MHLIFPILFFFFANAVFGFETEGVKSLSVMEGDSVTLHTCQNDIEKYDKLLWTYESERTRIAEFNKQNKAKSFRFSADDDERFRHRLKMDSETGSLTIRNIRTNHSGIYNVEMFGTSGSSNRKFNVTVTGVFDPDADKIKHMAVKEGESVTLDTDVKVQKDHLIVWKYAKVAKLLYNPLASAIAKLYGETLKSSFDDGESQMFKNKLTMDKRTGSLTVTDIRPEHSGFYMLEIINNTGTRHRRFNVTVSADAESNSHVVWKSIAITLMVCLLLCLSFMIFIIRNAKTCKKKKDGADGKGRDNMELGNDNESLVNKNPETNNSGDDQ